MKKAKIMLVAIAMLGIVGGTLAFKAQKFFGGTFFYATTTGPTHCFVNATTIQPVGVPKAFIGFKTLTTTANDYLYTVVGATTYYCTTLTTVYTSLGE